jgi:TolB-like protein/DNA-binding SARP family transcriptional activator
MIELRALGRLVLRGPQGEDLHTVLAQPKRVALLAYLAIARPRGFHRRDTLLALLWPELDDQHARSALNQGLHHLRSALGKEALPSRGDGEIGIDFRAVSCDAVEFEAAVEADDPARALELYRGDLLEGFHVSGGGEFERWLEEERVWLRRRAAGAAAVLAHREEARGEPVAAGHWARRAFALAPDDEREARNLIELLGRLGDRAGAVQAYEAFARRLRVEYEVDPAPETLAAIEAVRARQRATTSSLATLPDQPAGNVETVEPEPVPLFPSSGSPHLPTSPRRRWVVPWIIGLLLVGTIALFGVVVRGPGAPDLPAQPMAIAVLPFANMSPEGADEYFSDGMTEEIITALSKVEGLRVAARTSAFAFKGNSETVSEIGRQLGVGTVLEGSVRLAGDRLRVTAQLINVKDGYHLWAEAYDRDLRDVFAVQEEIAQAIVGALRVKLGGETTAMVVRPTADLAAYDHYLKGLHAVNQRSGGSLVQAVAYFEQAIARDPRFARAYAGLADAYVLLPGYSVTKSSEAWPKGRTAAERALALDSTLAEAHATLAYGKFLFDSDWRGAEQGFRQAIALNPRYPTAHHWYGDFLGGRGDLEGYLQEIRRAQALDPLSRQIGTEVGRALYALRRNDEAVTQLQQVLRADPAFAGAHVTLGRVYIEQGRLADAVGEFQQAVELRGRNALDVAYLAYAYAVAGQESEAQRLLVELEGRARREHVPPTVLAMVSMGLGQDERAFDYLHRAVAEHDGWIAESIFYPTFDPLRSHPRYAALLQALGLR